MAYNQFLYHQPFIMKSTIISQTEPYPRLYIKIYIRYCFNSFIEIHICFLLLYLCIVKIVYILCVCVRSHTCVNTETSVVYNTESEESFEMIKKVFLVTLCVDAENCTSVLCGS